jgi:hypothetical protein
VPEAQRRTWRNYGLARDEYPENGHRPHEFYVREARRLAGRYVFTEHDATLVPGLRRAPVHADGIAITEWYMDAHACTTARVPGSLDEGKMMLHQETFPGQLPYRALLPTGLDNLLVPVCASATHVAWGTVRLEPTWMNIGEAAAYATVQAIRRSQPPARIDADTLLRTLAVKRVMISFFNDVDVSAGDAWIPAAQYFGTKGFFADYEVRAAEPLKPATEKVWEDGLAGLKRGNLDSRALLREVDRAEREGESERERDTAPRSRRMRGEALVRMWEALAKE